MTGSLRDPRVAGVLDGLREAAAGDPARVAAIRPSAAARGLSPLQRAAERASVYMAIAPATGTLIYDLVRTAKPALVVEFGTSYGVSALHLGAAVKDAGGGRVLTTELDPGKVAAARASIAEAGLGDLVEVVEGDARETLVALQGEVGFVLLDGWKELYLPVLRLLEPHLAAGALVVADDSSFDAVSDYLAHVRDPAHGYESVALPIDDGIELSCRVG